MVGAGGTGAGGGGDCGEPLPPTFTHVVSQVEVAPRTYSWMTTLVMPGAFPVTVTWQGEVHCVPLNAPIRPDEPVFATVAGLREGRDEVLERGLALVEARPPILTNQN